MEGLIYQKMANILKETKAISKSEKNQQQGFKFRGIDNIMNELHDVFAKYEVFVLQEVKDFSVTPTTTARGTVLYYTRATISFKYMTTDGSFVETINVGEAMDSGDKGMNKAMSIALKYSLLQMLLIPTEESKDPDANTAEEQDALTLALQEIKEAQTSKDLVSIYNRWGGFQSNKDFVSALSAKKKEVQNVA